MREMVVCMLLAMIMGMVGCVTGEETGANRKAEWIANAFAVIESGIYPEIKAVSWWNENWEGTYLRIDTSTESLKAYQDAVNSSTFVTQANISSGRLVGPESGIYHAAFPDFGGTEDIVTAGRVEEFEELAGKELVWACFSDNWNDGIQFPSEDVNAILSSGKIPYIRLMPRTSFEEGVPEPNYTMQRIIDGVFDPQLTQWAIEAGNTETPLLAEFGTEVNGNWFPWNGQYNGAGETGEYGDPAFPDGPERFRDAYRHIINICRDNGADNITWFFHVDARTVPDVSWNQIQYYYPGDDYIDWLGVSVYGPMESTEDYIEFSEVLNLIYSDLCGLSDKPIAVLEFGITELE